MTTASARRAYLSLGSNLGDREGTLRAALAEIDALAGTRLLAVSTIIETPPWGVVDQPAFLNLAAIIETTLPPEALLAALKEIETAHGRQRTARWGPRTLDIDIVAYEREARNSASLSLPHPEATARRFVLEPLAEIAPDLCLRGKTVREWLAELPDE